MRLLEVNASEYQSRIAIPLHRFNTVAFSEHNRSKCESLHYFVWEQGSQTCLGLIAGRRESCLYSPFSAPCGGFTPVAELEESQIREAVELLCDWAKKASLKIMLYPPPHAYAPHFLETSFRVLKECGFKVEVEELNHQIPLTNWDSYANSLWRNGRKNLKTAEAQELVFEELPLSALSRSYEIIRENRIAREKPLRMSYSELLSTTNVIEAKHFIVRKDETDVAAAIVFHVAPQICQVIYWGDRPGYSSLRSMNFLAAKVVQYYLDQQFKWIDIGISTVDGIRNEGLCDFKESVGCIAAPRYKLGFQP